MTVVVRSAEVSDAERLARINIDAWRAAYTGLVPAARLDSMQVSEYADRWRRTITGAVMPATTVIVAELDGVVAAYCTGGPYRPQEDAAEEDTAALGELYAIYSDPALQGRGAGTAAHDALLAHLSLDGFTAAALWVLEANHKARDWYAGRGWRADGATAEWVSVGIAHPEIRMRRDLGGNATA